MIREEPDWISDISATGSIPRRPQQFGVFTHLHPVGNALAPPASSRPRKFPAARVVFHELADVVARR